MTDDERPSALLTQKQREFLREEDSDMSDRGERAARSRIRERVQNGLLDFTILAENLEGGDRDRIFAGEVDETDVEEVLPYLIAFLFQHHSEVRRDGSARELEDVVRDGVELGGVLMGHSLDVTTSIEARYLEPIEEVHERLKTDGVRAISFSELTQLVDAGVISREEYHSLHIEKTKRLEEHAKDVVDDAERDGAPIGATSLDEMPYILEEMKRRKGGRDDSDSEE